MEDNFEIIRNDYRSVFLGTPQGKRVLRDLQERNFFFATNLFASEPENIGRRNAIANIMNFLFTFNEPEQSVDAMNHAILSTPIYIQTTEKEDLPNG